VGVVLEDVEVAYIGGGTVGEPGAVDGEFRLLAEEVVVGADGDLVDVVLDDSGLGVAVEVGCNRSE